MYGGISNSVILRIMSKVFPSKYVQVNRFGSITIRICPSELVRAYFFVIMSNGAFICYDFKGNFTVVNTGYFNWG